MPDNLPAADRLSSLGLSNGLLDLLNQQFTKLVRLVVSAAPPLDLLAPVVGNVLVALPLFLALVVLLESLPKGVHMVLHRTRSTSYQLLGTEN